jgi:hypothetical protein
MWERKLLYSRSNNVQPRAGNTVVEKKPVDACASCNKCHGNLTTCSEGLTCIGCNKTSLREFEQVMAREMEYLPPEIMHNIFAGLGISCPEMAMCSKSLLSDLLSIGYYELDEQLRHIVDMGIVLKEVTCLGCTMVRCSFCKSRVKGRISYRGSRIAWFQKPTMPFPSYICSHCLLNEARVFVAGCTSILFAEVSREDLFVQIETNFRKRKRRV